MRLLENFSEPKLDNKHLQNLRNFEIRFYTYFNPVTKPPYEMEEKLSN